MNSNKFEFGRKQSGGRNLFCCICDDTANTFASERIDSVELPPWAKGDAHEFVRLNRQVRILLVLTLMFASLF